MNFLKPGQGQGHAHPPFPCRRESMVLQQGWIPAFAGMTVQISGRTGAA
jgi:hypothetical protein